MDGRYSWRITEETEIDLADLLRRLCRQWKQAAACALVFALALGVYGWQKDPDTLDTSGSDVTETAPLTEAEEQAVADAVRLKNEIRGLEAYLSQSVLMQIDPYHKTKYIMLFSIGHADSQELPKITESYLNFILNGGAADALAESESSWKMEKNCMAELISAYQKTYSSPYPAAANGMADDSFRPESLFYIEITGKDTQTAKKMALDMQDVLEKHSAEIEQAAGSHRLKLVSSAESITADSGLQSQQHDKKALLSSNKTSLKSMTDAFSAGQMAAYQEAAGVEDAESGKEAAAPEEMTAGQNTVSEMKYILLGLAGGIFAYCCIFVCWYIFRDTVKSTEEMRRMYTFPVYGGILLKGSTGEKQPDAFGCTKEQVFGRVRLACQKQGISKLCAASDFPLDVPERECLESMAGQLKEYGIDLAVAESVSADIAAWDGLSETGNVLMVCRIGTTTRRMIDHAMQFYLENGIAVMGAAVFQTKNRIWL